MARRRDTEPLDPFTYKRRKRLPRWLVPVALMLLLIAAAVTYFLQGPTIGTRDVERKILAVMLPPPPPPPPPPPKEKPPEPPKPMEEAKVEPAPPTPTPPAPDANDALSAREGPAAGNFGLAAGNGGGTRIGGGVGGDPLAAYALIVQSDVRKAIEADPVLKKASYNVQIVLKISPDGVIQDVQLQDPNNDEDRDAAIRKLLVRLMISRPPPSGLPPLRLQLASRSSF